MVSGVGGQIAYPTFDVRRSTFDRQAKGDRLAALGGEGRNGQAAIGDWQLDGPAAAGVSSLAGNWKLETGNW